MCFLYIQTDAYRPKVVKRGVDETFENIENGESTIKSHLQFWARGEVRLKYD